MDKRTDIFHLWPTDRSAGAWFGDPVPFYWNQAWHLFYVWDQGHLRLPRVSHAWGHFVSRDLVHWDEQPFAIEPGEEASCGTGSVFESDGTFHMYYIGRYFTSNGVMYASLCHATSSDLTTWTKDSANPISLPDPDIYSISDWRDGFPFWNSEAGEYWMLVTASLKDGPEPYRGALALMTSPDLDQWEIREPYWAPNIGRHLECPDLFEWNGWWYLLFSGEQGYTWGTFYRRARTMNGPWEAPSIDTFDGQAFYAAKTAGDQSRRMICGWVGTHFGDTDAGRTQWGGHAVIRELVQDSSDGTLWVKCPEERLQMGRPYPTPKFSGRLGSWTSEAGIARGERENGFAYATGRTPSNFILRFEFEPQSAPRRFGVLVRTDDLLTGATGSRSTLR